LKKKETQGNVYRAVMLACTECAELQTNADIDSAVLIVTAAIIRTEGK